MTRLRARLFPYGIKAASLRPCTLPWRREVIQRSQHPPATGGLRAVKASHAPTLLVYRQP